MRSRRRDLFSRRRRRYERERVYMCICITNTEDRERGGRRSSNLLRRFEDRERPSCNNSQGGAVHHHPRAHAHESFFSILQILVFFFLPRESRETLERVREGLINELRPGEAAINYSQVVARAR